MQSSQLVCSILLFLSLFNPSLSEAKLLQILHTNDTHSYLDNATHSTTVGGAARLKTLIDSFKNSMSEKGIPTLVVDAGDFLEGNAYFMAQAGRKSFEVHNEMGYDIGTLGNHDYQMGSVELDKLLGEVDLKFSLIVANFDTSDKYKALKNKITPYKEIEFDGMKIAFLGLTTDEVFYKWRLMKGAIANPIETGQKFEKILKKRNNDFIIALTHIGVLRDIKLAEKTENIDLIIGGHSHTALFQPSYGINKRKQKVPVVQAGEHTEYLGRLVVDLVKGKPLKIVSYELVPVKLVDAVADREITKIVENADSELDAIYGKDWLNEKIGFSDLEVGDSEGTHKWAYFITDTMKEKTGADIAIHSPDMNGSNYPVGAITRRSIINSIPRVFELDQKYGWDIYTVKIKGVWLKLTMDALAFSGKPLTFSGLKMEYFKTPLGFTIKKLLVNGKKINPFKTYTVAFTEGIVKGAEGIDARSVTILRNTKNTNFKIWATLEERLQMGKDSLSKVCIDSNTILWPPRLSN